MTFGDPHFDVMDVTRGHRVYKRKVTVTGTNAYQLPFTPKKPNL